MPEKGLEKVKEYFGAIILMLIGSLFGMLGIMGTSLIMTWSQTNQNTENIAENREDHEASGADRFTRSNAERMEDRQQLKNEAMRDEILELVKEVWYLKGLTAKE